ncbi:MAG: TonB-dependent receptor [Acidobacteriia bacterium]|nr:TonB-dependent receptor [Terriglobia bacterium]
MRIRRCLLLAIILSSVNAWGQTSAGFGAVTGTVLDAQGEGLPDCIVVLSNKNLGTERTMSTTDDGIFHSSTVVPSENYELRISRKDFVTWNSGPFTISTGQDVSFEVTLPVAENGGGPQATGGARLVDNTLNGLGAVISPQQMDVTPLSGRRLTPLALLAPAVTEADALPGVLVFHGVPFSNILLTDGLSTINTYLTQKPGLAKQLPQDSVEDFQVASADFTPEYGGTMGGIVNAATRAGTNDYHGEVYDYFRDRSLQAEDRYAAGYDVRQLQHQGGAELGGPIRPGKIFFFVNVEALYRKAQGLNRITNPLIADLAGARVSSSNCQATAAQCALAARFLQSQMNVLEPLWEHSVRGVARVDYRRSERNNLRLEGNILQWHAPTLAETEAVAPNGGLIGDPNMREQTRYAKLGWTANGTSQITNDLRLGFFQNRITQDPTPAGLATGPLGITIAGTTVGATQPYSVILPAERRLEAQDNGYWTIGPHSIKVGADYSKTRDYINSLANADGLYTYPSLTSFAQDFGLTGLRSYTSFSQTLGTASRSLTYNLLSAYAEDTWRANRRITVDFGLRYDHPHLPQPTQVNTSYFQTATIPTPWLNLAPRAGVAYMVNSRTVVRAGFGFYYSPISGQLLDALFLGNNIYQTTATVNPNQSGSPVFPNIYPAATSFPSGTQNITYTTSAFRNPYSQETSIALERRFSADTTLTLNLLHSRGFRLWTTEDFNQANPSSGQATTETYNILNASGQPAGTYALQYWIARNNGAFAHVFQTENGGSSWYNAASVQLRKRLSHGFTAMATYTWSHAIDNAGQNLPFGAGISSFINAAYTADRGNSSFDQRHRAVIQWSWQPALGQNYSGVTRRALNGWSLSTLTTLASSQFLTPIVVVQGQQFSGVSMNYTSSLNGSGGWARVPFEQINSLPTGPEYNVDARIARTFAITERFRATVLFESFNLFNTQFNTSVNTVAFTASPVVQSGLLNGPTTGTLKPVPGVGAGNASWGYPDGTNARRVQLAIRVVF